MGCCRVCNKKSVSFILKNLFLGEYLENLNNKYS